MGIVLWSGPSGCSSEHTGCWGVVDGAFINDDLPACCTWLLWRL